jgi:RluA family pseudouridine synthase
MFGIEIVYEDEAIVVMNKPSGLLSISTRTDQKRTAFFALNDYLNRREQFTAVQNAQHSKPVKVLFKKQIFIVHRLDQATSGLLIFAKSHPVKHSLQNGWKDVRKRYYAVVEGVPAKKEGRLESFLMEQKTLRVASVPESRDAKWAVTEYRVVRQCRGYAFLHLELGTGRKHQIRVQLSEMGHPIAGDRDYGAASDPLHRLALHAGELKLSHPVSGAPLHFKCPPPAIFSRLMEETPKDVGSS